jgi:hypothetical protein
MLDLCIVVAAISRHRMTCHCETDFHFDTESAVRAPGTVGRILRGRASVKWKLDEAMSSEEDEVVRHGMDAEIPEQAFSSHAARQ